VLDHDSQVAARDVAVGDKFVHDVAGEVDRDGKSNALDAAAAAQDGGIDTDEPALSIHERAARVAGVDRGVRLDEVLVIEPDAAGAAGGADDAGGDRLADAERIANRQDDVAHFDLFTIRHLDGGQ